MYIRILGIVPIEVVLLYEVCLATPSSTALCLAPSMSGWGGKYTSYKELLCMEHHIKPTVLSFNSVL